MNLRFVFVKIIDNKILEHVLFHACEYLKNDHDFEFGLDSFAKSCFLYIKADVSILELLCDKLANLIPHSIFFKLENVETCPEFESCDVPKCELNLPFSPLDIVKYRQNACYFEENFKQICKDDKLHFALNDENTPFYAKDHAQIIQKVAKLLKEDKAVLISTIHGDKIFKKSDQKAKLIMPTDSSYISRICVATKQEKEALLSFEKPMIELRINAVYKSKIGHERDFIKVCFAKSLLLWLICEAIKDEVEFLSISEDENYHASLKYEQINQDQNLEINVLENGFITHLKDTKLLKAKKFLDFTKQSHERFSTLLYEHELFNTKSFCFYLSQKHDDSFMFYAPKAGLIDVFALIMPKNSDEIFQSLQNDKTAAKLLDNYAKKYELKKPKLDFSSHPKNFFTLIGIAGVFLDFGDDPKSAALCMLRLAKRYSGTKGVRIDVGIKDDKINIAKMIQSGLSFRLAGADDELICYGYFESVVYFLSRMSDRYAQELKIEHICLAGSFFSFKRALELLCKNIQKNYPLKLLEGFSLDT